MVERRRSKRMPITMELNISELYSQLENHKDIDADIKLFDISKHGMGFETDADLPLDYYFNADIKLNSDEDAVIHTIAKIVRECDDDTGVYKYGCEFVGLAPILDFIFDKYSKTLDEDSDSDTATDK